MKRRLAYILLDILAEILRAISRPANRYALAFRVLDWLARLGSRVYFMGAPAAYRANPTAELLNHVLCYYTKRRIAFTLPVVVHDLAVLHVALQSGQGAVIGTAHTRLSFALHKALRVHGIVPVFVGLFEADAVKYNWDHPAPIARIESSSPNLFAACARVLKSGNVVVPYVDFGLDVAEPGRPAPVGISPNAFIWAAEHDVPILLMTNRMDASGTIHIALHRPVCVGNTPLTQGHEAAEAMGALMAQTLGWECRVVRPKHSRAVSA